MGHWTDAVIISLFQNRSAERLRRIGRSRSFLFWMPDMRTHLNVLDNLQVASPCHAEWNDMVGNDRVRFCGQCEKSVYNLSQMTRQEALDLVQEKEGNLCVRFFRRHDGTMITTDCPVGVHHKIRRRRKTAGVFASVASLLFMSGCANEEAPDSMPNEKPIEQLLSMPAPAGKGGPMMGKPTLVQGGICAPPNLPPAQPAPMLPALPDNGKY